MKDNENMRKPSNANFRFEVNSPDKRSIYKDSPGRPISGIEQRRNYENVQIHDQSNSSRFN